MREAEERRGEAEEAKREQELLIDITSCVARPVKPTRLLLISLHRPEIRNPISLLMQCSSLVKTNLSALLEQLESVLEHDTSFVPTRQLLTSITEDLEALESIYQRGLSQERISDEVLSLGKIQLGQSYLCNHRGVADACRHVAYVAIGSHKRVCEGLTPQRCSTSSRTSAKRRKRSFRSSK